MKIYNLPQDEEFSRDIMNDLKRAKKVVLISPFLSTNVIKEWRKEFKNCSNEDFTIVYDINEKELDGKPDEKLITSITWRSYEKLHSKIYYFKFDKGYSFYHGSANLTNSGVGNKEIGNREIMSRITSNTTLNENIQDLINHYIINSKIEVPAFFVKPPGIVQQYKMLLKRLEPNTPYRLANAKTILKVIDSDLKFFQGIYVSINKKPKKFIKFHTTNIIGKNPEFTISKEELHWFTGGFDKNKCKTKNRMLYLVWKLDGYYYGRLNVFQLYPIDLWNLLKKSNRSTKINFDNNSLTISISNVEGFYVLKRNNSRVIIPANQVKLLNAMKVNTSSKHQVDKVEVTS